MITRWNKNTSSNTHLHPSPSSPPPPPPPPPPLPLPPPQPNTLITHPPHSSSSSSSDRLVTKKPTNLFSRLTHISLHPHRSSSSLDEASDPSLIDQTVGWYCRSDHHLQNWSHLFEFADRLSKSQPECKQAVKAIKRNLKLLANPDHQIRAIRLTVILALNSSDRLRLLIVKKLLPSIEEVYHKALKNPRAQQVPQTILKALSVLGHEFRHDEDLSAFTNLYNKIKPAHAPLNGAPLVQSDGLFAPASSNPLTPAPPQPSSYHPVVAHGQPNIPTMRDVRAEAEIARNNARVLIGALAFTAPAEMGSNEIIQEFHTKCLESQCQLVDDISWATERAAQARNQLSSLTHQQSNPQAPARLPRTDPYAELTNPTSTREEQLLELLISANCELTDAFQQYNELERLARDEQEIRLVEERSKVETRHGLHSNGLLYPQGTDHPLASGSSSNPSPRQSFEPGSSTRSSFVHPLSLNRSGRAQLTAEPEKIQPTSARPGSKDSATQGYHLSEDSHGDADYYVSTRSTSQQQSPAHSEQPQKLQAGKTRTGRSKDADDESEIATPVEPSEKALGKMRRISTRVSSFGPLGPGHHVDADKEVYDHTFGLDDGRLQRIN